MKKPPLGLPEGRSMKSEKRIRDLRDLKGFGALCLKLYLELSFRILNIILCFNFKLHFELKATKKERSEA